MKFLHLTDIHLTTPGRTIAGRDPNANFRRALDHALDRHGDAEALFITGDLSDWGGREDYLRLRDEIADVSMPVHLMTGNHDVRAAFLEVFPDLRGAGGFVQRVVDLSLGQAVLLDTVMAGTHAGHFCTDRAAWLSQTLADLPGPVWLFMHHNPVPTGLQAVDDIMLLDAERFRAAIAPHASKIRHIFHGHCHLPLSGALMGIPFSAPRGTNHASWAHFEAPGNFALADLYESYAVVMAEGDSTMVHTVEFGYPGAVHVETAEDDVAPTPQTA